MTILSENLVAVPTLCPELTQGRNAKKSRVCWTVPTVNTVDTSGCKYTGEGSVGEIWKQVVGTRRSEQESGCGVEGFAR